MSREVSRLALAVAVERLERALTLTRERLQADIDYQHKDMHVRWYPPSQWDECCSLSLPETQRDKNGRYIVLDALTAIVAAQTALVALGAGP